MLSAILAFMIHLFLTVDLFLLHFFGYHINGLVVNLLLTPGGFESMGLDWHSLLPGGCMIVLLVALEILLAWWCLTENKAEKAANKLKRHPKIAWIAMATFAICFIVTLGCGGVASFKAYVPVMESMDTYPLYPNIRMRHFLRAIGMKENTNREFALQGENRNTSLNYPSAPITRKAHGKTNIVWLVAESLRADMLTSEIMPNAWRMASRGWRFPLHFSGGNGTRPGMFSMFYGLYANNWNAFLRSSRSPLVEQCNNHYLDENLLPLLKEVITRGRIWDDENPVDDLPSFQSFLSSSIGNHSNPYFTYAWWRYTRSDRFKQGGTESRQKTCHVILKMLNDDLSRYSKFREYLFSILFMYCGNSKYFNEANSKLAQQIIMKHKDKASISLLFFLDRKDLDKETLDYVMEQAAFAPKIAKPDHHTGAPDDSVLMFLKNRIPFISLVFLAKDGDPKHLATLLSLLHKDGRFIDFRTADRLFPYLIFVKKHEVVLMLKEYLKGRTMRGSRRWISQSKILTMEKSSS